MSEEEDSYCRLCAEPTAKSQLIAPDEDVGLNSKIATKMLWINVDVSPTNSLPNSICFSCFDLLERTWSFLNNVRTAQTKLNEIFLKNTETEKKSFDVKEDPDITIGPDLVGKPINEDWEDFEQLKQDVKPDILNEQLQIMTVDPNTLIDLGVVKTERNSIDDDYRPESDGFNTTDSDMPLYEATKKKKIKKKHKLKDYSDEPNIIIDNTKELTWEDYVCICGDCDAQCKNIMSLRLHSLQIHAHCCIFKCAECGKVTSSNKTFLNHVRSHYKCLQECCEYCNKSFVCNVDLKRHRNQFHGEAIKTSCRHCGSTFDNLQLLEDHLVIYSKNSRKRMKSIKLDFNEELKCDLCDKEFKTRGNLLTHKLVHTERKRNFSCHICGKMFFTKGTLITHLTTHDDNKPFKCEFCPLTFKARGNLQSHISLHSGAKPFVCEQCGKSFRAKRHLKSHSIVHTDLMPYVCNFCKKTFRFKTRLNLHLRQHTGAKPYKCIYCQRDFTNGSNYKKHMKRKHNIDTSRKKYNNVVASEEIDSSK